MCANEYVCRFALWPCVATGKWEMFTLEMFGSKLFMLNPKPKLYNETREKNGNFYMRQQCKGTHRGGVEAVPHSAYILGCRWDRPWLFFRSYHLIWEDRAESTTLASLTRDTLPYVAFEFVVFVICILFVKHRWVLRDTHYELCKSISLMLLLWETDGTSLIPSLDDVHRVKVLKNQL